MGILTSGEYETLEGATHKSESGQLKTRTGKVEHNGVMVRQPGDGSSGRSQGSGSASANMANDLLIQPDSGTKGETSLMTGHELDCFLGKAFEEKPIWTGLYESIHDTFFPPKLPPLELTSTPIPVPDRMAVKANPVAIGISTTVNVAILLVLLFFLGKKIIETVAPKLVSTNVDVSQFDLKAPKMANAAGGGGGGGSHDIVDPIKGKLPPRMKDPITPPSVPMQDPKLAVPAAIDVQKSIVLPDNPNLPNIGVKNSANVTLASNGSGGGGGMGSGYGGGLGSGTGNGYGPGYGSNTGGGLERV